MKKALKFGSPVLTIVLFVLAGILLLGSSIGGARAALTYYSETYSSQIQMKEIGVALCEKNDGEEESRIVSYQDYNSYTDGNGVQGTGELLTKLLGEGESIQPGRAYPEVISARNIGEIDEYVRISLYTYWVEIGEDGTETKRTDLDPELISFKMAEGSAWLEDKAAQTESKERKVYYYTEILKPNAETSPLTTALTIDGSVAKKVTKTEKGVDVENVDGIDGGKSFTRITVTYDYDGVEFRVEAVVDAVQTHNAEDAILSAWGRKVRINNGRLALVD